MTAFDLNQERYHGTEATLDGDEEEFRALNATPSEADADTLAGASIASSTWPPSAAAGYAEMAAELQQLEPYLPDAVALALVQAQVAVAGWPAAGAGMATEHEWTEQQVALLEAAQQECSHAVASSCQHYS